MATNHYLNNYAAQNEQRLLEDLIVESIKIMGFDAYYIPIFNPEDRDILYGEDPLKRKYFDDYKKKTNGKRHLKDLPKKIETKNKNENLAKVMEENKSELNNFSKINIFVGNNNSGKSSKKCKFLKFSAEKFASLKSRTHKNSAGTTKIGISIFFCFIAKSICS